MTTCTKSFVHNGSMDYHAWAHDFKLPDGTPGCATCSSGGDLGEGLHAVRAERYLRSRLDSHGVSSFGRLSALKGYDVSLKWPEEHLESIMSLHEAGQINSVAQLNWQASRMTWAPINSGTPAFGLTLYDTSGSPLTTFADRELAHTGVFLKADGDSIHFEIIRKGTQVYGRPVAFADRNGNLTTVEYVDAQPTFGTDVSTISEYFRRTKITDPYGRELLFEYTLEGSNYVVSKIIHPDAESTEYRYTNLSFYGKVISEVDHPDGSMSTETWNKNNATGFWELEMFEATGEPGKRRKTIFISTNSAPDDNGVVIATVAGLTRMVLNGEGEMTYGNRTLDNGDRFVYAGGNKAFIVDISGSSKGLGKYTEVTNGASLQNNFFTIDPADLNTIEAFDLTNGNDWQQKENTDALGRTQLFPTSDPVSKNITRVEESDGTAKDIAYNSFATPATITDRLGRVTQREFDAFGNLTKETRGFGDPSAATEEWIYNAQGLVTEKRDPLYDPAFPDLHNTQYQYDANNFPVKIIYSADTADGTRPETAYTYDFAGRIATITNPRAAVTTFTYDTHSRPIEVLYADGSTDLITYGTGDDANLVLAKTNRNGITTEYEYDLADRKVITRTAAGLPEEITELCTFLIGSDLEISCTKRGEKTTHSYDHQNRRISTTRHANSTTALTSTTEYDVLDRRRSTTDAYGRRTFYLYDENDSITRTVTELVPNGLGTVPDFVNDSSQTATQTTRDITLTNGETVTLAGIHDVTYTDPRDLFLESLTRDLAPNAAYLITDRLIDAEGQTLTSTDPRGIESLMLYDVLGRVLRSFEAITLPEERLTESDFDKASNLVETRMPRYFSETEDDGTGTQVPIRAVEQYTYNGRNLRASHTIAAGHPTLEATQTWTYLLDGKPSTHTDARGNLSRSYWRACCGRLQATVARDGTSTSISNTDFEGNATHTATTSTPPLSNYSDPVDADTLQETTTRFDGLGRPTHSTSWLVPLGTVDDSARVTLGDPTGVPIAGLDTIPATDGLTTTFEYDEDLTDGIGLDLTYAAQFVQLAARGTTFNADANGFAVATTNPEGETTVQIRDGLGRPVMSINPEGHISTMTYDEVLPVAGTLPAHLAAIPVAGDLLLTTSTDPYGHETIQFADAAGRTLVTQDPAGNLSGTAYDANSNMLKSRDANGLGQDCTYDALNRDTTCADLQEQAEATTRSKTYNAHNAVLTSTDAEGNTSSITYDARDRQLTSTDANNITTTYGYDLNNNLLTLTDPKGATRSWTYDTRNLKLTKVMPDPADTCSYSYDALGRLTVKTQQDSSTITMIYDLAGRMTQRDYSDSTSDTFTYDGASRLLTATKGRHAITVTRTYAADSQQLSETFDLDGRTYALARTYDADNLVTSQTFADNKVMTWAYDSRHLVTSANYDGDLVLTQSHDAGYRLTQQAFGNGLTRDITYNRLDNLRTADAVRDGNSPIDELEFGYSYAPDKNVLVQNQSGGLFENLSFTAAYDAGNRVINFDRKATYIGARENQSWNYDPAGNWNSTTIDGDTKNRTHSQSDELQSIDGDNLTYDSRGNQLSDNRNNDYTWDIDNRLVESKTTGYTDIEYRYDALGRRIVRKQGTTKEVLLWWGNTEQSEHKHQAGQTTIQNDLQANPSEQALNTIFARALEGHKYDIQYFHKNYLDHVMAVSADNGDLLEHYRYTAFGEPEIYAPNGVRLNVTNINNDILWNSRRYESASGLYMYLYRHYDAASGRWPSRDPIEEDGGVNLYVFIWNNPVYGIDYLGLCKIKGKCELVKSTPSGIGGLGADCEYQCTEDTSKDREQPLIGIGGIPVNCADIPKPYIWHEGDSTLCTLCKDSYDTTTRVTDINWGDCSRKECRDNCGVKLGKGRKACRGNPVCLAALVAVNVTCNEACEATCKNP